MNTKTKIYLAIGILILICVVAYFYIKNDCSKSLRLKDHIGNLDIEIYRSGICSSFKKITSDSFSIKSNLAYEGHCPITSLLLIDWDKNSSIELLPEGQKIPCLNYIGFVSSSEPIKENLEIAGCLDRNLNNSEAILTKTTYSYYSEQQYYNKIVNRGGQMYLNNKNFIVPNCKPLWRSE